MITLRCSSLDRLRACQASAGSDGVLLDHSDEAGALGTAVHEGMPWLIRGEPRDVEILARKHEVDEGELGMLLAVGRKCWSEIGHWFPEPQFEVAMRAERDGVLLTGHADLMSSVATEPDAVMDDELRILDWKSGRADTSHDYQLRGYAWLGMASQLPMAGFNTVRVCVVRLREQSAEWHTYTQAELDEWFAGLVERVRGPERFSPGSHCSYCPRAATCEARGAMLQYAAKVLQVVLPAARFPDDPTDCGDVLVGLLERKRWLERLCAEVGDLVKSQVQHRGGWLPTSDGREVVIAQQERQAVNVAAGWGLLLDALERNGLLPLLSIGKTDLEKAVREANGKGKAGGVAWKELWARLEQAGAIETTYQDRLEVRRSEQPAPALENKA